MWSGSPGVTGAQVALLLTKAAHAVLPLGGNRLGGRGVAVAQLRCGKIVNYTVSNDAFHQLQDE
jgi:hypothetical protein